MGMNMLRFYVLYKLRVRMTWLLWNISLGVYNKPVEMFFGDDVDDKNDYT